MNKENPDLIPDLIYKDLYQRLQAYVLDPKSLQIIEKAYHFALEKHKGQLRKSGEDYICHPLTVACILSELKVDLASIVSALLHDVVEDTDTSLDEIEATFGSVVANLVDGLTKIRKIKFRSNQERMADNFRKMILAMAKDLRVILVKLADRLHNMRTISAHTPHKRLRIAQETLDIYAPLASRLGIYGFKSELEDLCLKETKNSIYKEISRKISAKKQEREDYIQEMIEILEEKLKNYGFQNAKVYGRPKHFYSIYKKMVDRQLAIEDIHDLFAFRIIVDSIKDCYEALGMLHTIWKPMPGRFKDYIAMPKANMYQSLHTTVIRSQGSPAEIQIRTHDMNYVCEYGIAAHWAYKQKGQSELNATASLKEFSWLRQMMELHHDVKDPEEFLDAVKVDLFEEEIFVFTPKGDVIPLAAGATSLDFAFSVHTDVGLSAAGAKVNGKMVPLRRELHSGDIVEILTSNKQHPSKDWLSFVTTSKAKNKIRSHLRTEQRAQSRKIGRELLGHELRKRSLGLEYLTEPSKSELILKSSKESSIDELLVAIGYGKINPKELLERSIPNKQEPEVLPEPNLTAPRASTANREVGVLVSGLKNILVTYGKCCNPLPGEAIVGFITRGRGVSVHRHNCTHALDLDPARRIEVSWEESDRPPSIHSAHLRVVTQDRQGILAEITTALASCGANVIKAQVRVSKDLMGILDFEVAIKDLSHLHEVIGKLEGVTGVVFAERRENNRSKRNHKG